MFRIRCPSAGLKRTALLQYLQVEVSDRDHLSEALVRSKLFKASSLMKGNPKNVRQYSTG